MNGGPVRAYQYPRLDSLLWKSAEAIPALGTILSFDRENGELAYVDRKGLPGWIDLHVGTTVPATKTVLTDLMSNDGWAIFGVRRDSTVQRLTPTGEWSIKLRGKIANAYPLPDGALLAVLDRGQAMRLVRVRPPDNAILDSVTVPSPDHAAIGPLGNRLYLAAQNELYIVSGVSLARTSHVRMRAEIEALIPSPSGDRVYVLTKNRRELDVVDRFTSARSVALRLPGVARDLRMDPLGRFLLVRPAHGDSAWVVAIGTNTVVAAIATDWRADLPAIASDGSVATVRGRDVAFVVPGERGPRIIVKDGANDVWQLLYWNGFRPRAKGLDQPVVFPEESTATPPPAPTRDTVAPAKPARVDSAPPKPRPLAPSVDTAARAPTFPKDQWTVSFAAVLSESRAQELANSITVDGRHPRVVVTMTEGVRVNRVVLGPYPTRADAERVGRESGHSYWVFAGAP